MVEYPRFELPFDVMIHMSDARGLCRAADIMRFLQESATRQLEALGPTLAELKTAERAFILSRISIDFTEPIHTYDTIRVATWPCASSRGAIFDRNFEVFGQSSDTPAAVCASQWAFLDLRDKRLLRVEDADISFTRAETVTTSLPLRFRIPKEIQLIPVGEKIVRYSDIDTNQHMNNTRYCDLYCDCLPMEGHRVAALAISFQKEAAEGETISVLRSEMPDEDGCFYFRTVRASDGAVNTEAVVRLTAI